MDIAFILGMILAITFTLISMGSGALGFVDGASVMITFGGAFSCVLAEKSIKEMKEGFASFKLCLKVPAYDTPGVIKKIIELSNVARKEGLLSLEEAAGDIEDAFLKKGILLIVDGTDPELVRAIMETEMVNCEERHKGKIAFWDDVNAMGPGWGQIGTLIGLINMLRNMSDAASLGPNMAVAMITTFYGAMLSNWVCAPIANKLKGQNSAEMMVKEIEIEGLLSIQAGENPRVIEEKLKSFLAPKERATESEEGAEGAEGTA